MIRFRVFSLPRAGSSWVSTWLSSPSVPCIHDPSEYCRSLVDYNVLNQHGDCGICCTGGWLLAGWGKDTPTILLDRPVDEVQRSLARIDLGQLPDDVIDRWRSLDWPRFTLEELQGGGAADVWRYLRPWDIFPRRLHSELCKLNIQPCDRELDRVRKAMKEVA